MRQVPDHRWHLTSNSIFVVVRYGIVLKKLDLREDALEVMQESVNKEPLHWGSWLELSSLCSDKETVSHIIY